MATVDNFDVIIYLRGSESVGFRITYELKKSLTTEVKDAIKAKLKKSFSLGGSNVDTFYKPTAMQKTRLMQLIFTRDYGLTSNVIILK